MDSKENSAWKSFRDVVENFLGKHKSENYKELVHNLIYAYQDIKANMVKLKLRIKLLITACGTKLSLKALIGKK